MTDICLDFSIRKIGGAGRTSNWQYESPQVLVTPKARVCVLTIYRLNVACGLVKIIKKATRLFPCVSLSILPISYSAFLYIHTAVLFIDWLCAPFD